MRDIVKIKSFKVDQSINHHIIVYHLFNNQPHSAENEKKNK